MAPTQVTASSEQELYDLLLPYVQEAEAEVELCPEPAPAVPADGEPETAPPPDSCD